MSFWFLGFKKCFMFSKDIWYILPNFHFMFLNRYGIHIQDLGDFIKRIVIIFRCPSFRKRSTFWASKISTFKKMIFFEMPHGIFLTLLRCPGVSKDKINWFWGLVTGSKIPKSWNLEFWAFKIMKSGFYYTDPEQINSRKLLKVLFKNISLINCPKLAIIIPINFPMIFPRISWMSSQGSGPGCAPPAPAPRPNPPARPVPGPGSQR